MQEQIVIPLCGQLDMRGANWSKARKLRVAPVQRGLSAPGLRADSALAKGGAKIIRAVKISAHSSRVSSLSYPVIELTMLEAAELAHALLSLVGVEAEVQFLAKQEKARESASQ